MNVYSVTNLNWLNDELCMSSINDNPHKNDLLKTVQYFESNPSNLIGNKIHVLSLQFTPESEEEAIDVLRKIRMAHSLGPV